MGWISARGDCSDIHPFFKSWIAMVETQKALNLGGDLNPEVQRWLKSGLTWTQRGSAIDPFFGCSAALPPLMVSHCTGNKTVTIIMSIVAEADIL